MTQKYPEVDGEYKVLVRSLVYNHEKYITDALRGFVSQITDFPFIVSIEEDYSTDGTRAAIVKYIEKECIRESVKEYECESSFITKADSNVNPNCHFVFYFFKFNHYSIRYRRDRYLVPWYGRCRYVALCECDDYWTDPLKLQHQYMIMEAHPSVTLCHTAFQFFFTESGDIQNAPLMPDAINNLSVQKSILDHNSYRVQTCTALFRLSSYQKICDEYSDCFSKRFLMGDTQLWVLLLTKGDVYYIPDSTAIYRISKESACRSSNFTKQLRFNVSCGEMRIFLMRRLSMPEDELFNKLYREYSVNALRYLLICPDFKPMFSLLKAHRFVYYLSHMPVFGNVLAKRIANRISIQ